MKPVAMDILTQWWFQLAASGLVGFWTGYHFYVKGLREPIVCYIVKAMRVFALEAEHGIKDSINVTYRGIKIERLSVAMVTFWNGGNAVLDGKALVDRDPLRISVDDSGQIVDAAVVSNPNPECNCRVTICGDNNKSARFSFDYLNQQNGCTIRVLHTSESDIAQVRGALKGIRRQEGSILLASSRCS